MRLNGCLLSLALLLSSTAMADDNAALMQAVHGFLHDRAQALGDEIIVELHPPSARLPACEAPEPFLTRDGELPLGRVSVGVRCGSDGRQVRYLQAEIGVIGHYPVLNRALAAGESVREKDLELREGNLADLPSRALLDGETIVGQVATRPLRAGEPLQEHQFRALPLVERNQRVSIEAHGSGFRISREGQALEPGGLGDRVRVRLSSREVITAEVIGDATLVVDF
ncbi:flagellar basal body P-ring formation protein FlgA [Halomonas campisalis]|uniref:Flagella basal body P-ring formation protein FlgA n=2 Tax=Billgrantia campisalis TaxID=74661 RepID=A0ABS9P3A0_9GAMM|nr:flagellar basal body P-ring formation protein FlgA [Halomonas campisalis]